MPIDAATGGVLASVVGALSSGGLAGGVALLGTWLQKKEERKALKVRYAHEEKMAEHQLKAQAQGAQISMQEAAEKSLQSSYSFGAAGPGWAANLVSLMRPVLTLAWTAITLWVVWQVHGSAGSLPADLVESIIFLTTASTLWWFGARPGRFSDKQR